jgi:molybdopterin molybdotransferase/putative molybdopterin biosynthesis protein
VGDELIPIGATLQRGKNIDANSLMAEQMLIEMGAAPMCYPIVSDCMGELKRTLRHALGNNDIVIVGGGSSKGEEDFGTRLIQAEGELIFHGVAAVPGRPIGAGIVDHKPVVNISGPTLAAFYGMDWFMRPIVHRCLRLPVIRRPTVRATLVEDMICPEPMEFLCRLHAWKTADGGFEIRPLVRGQASMAEMISSNSMFISKIGEKFYKKGSELEIELLRDEEYL